LLLLFDKQAKEGPRISGEKCSKVLDDFGLECVNKDLPIGREGIDFPDLLRLIEQLRIDTETEIFAGLEGRFRQFASSIGQKDKVPAIEVVRFLEEVEVQAEQDTLRYCVEDLLTGSSTTDGSFSFTEVRRCLQRFHEHLAREEKRKEKEAAELNGFQESELDELHQAFDQLDADSSGSLDIDEILNAVHLLKFTLSTAVIHAVIRQVDVDNSGTIDFTEFLQMMRLVRDREGCFAENRAVKTVEDLKRHEMLQLIGYFGIQFPPEQVDSIEEAVLLQRVCECFQVEKNASLALELNVRTFQDLVILATQDTYEHHSDRAESP